MASEFRFFERDPYSPITYVYEVEEVLYRGRSPYQEFAVVTNPYFGRMLVLDGVVQFTERDEFLYHEMLAHVVMHAVERPRTVVVIGGGDGGAVREVLKHDGVERVYLVDIDPEVSHVSREYFPTVSSALSDPRVREKPMDGAVFVRELQEPVDVVIVDSTDIMGHARSLFSEDFYGQVHRVLGDKGMFVTLSESVHFHLPLVRQVQNTLKKVFPVVDLYTAPIATYAGNWWCYAVASKGADPRKQLKQTVEPKRYYCSEVHETCFMPRFLYERIMEEGRESL